MKINNTIILLLLVGFGISCHREDPNMIYGLWKTKKKIDVENEIDFYMEFRKDHFLVSWTESTEFLAPKAFEIVDDYFCWTDSRDSCFGKIIKVNLNNMILYDKGDSLVLDRTSKKEFLKEYNQAWIEFKQK